MFVEPLDVQTIDYDDYNDTQELVQRRQVIITKGAEGGAVTAAKVLEGWHDLKLIKGTPIRGTTVPPSIDLASAQEALHKVAPDAGGTVFGDYLIRTVHSEGKVVSFTVHQVS
jgi:hypothetical protein